MKTPYFTTSNCIKALNDFPKSIEKIFIGVQEGIVVKKLTHNKRGQVRDFDRVLIPKGYNKTFAEFTKKEVKEYDERIWRPCVFDRFIGWFKKNG